MHTCLPKKVENYSIYTVFILFTPLVLSIPSAFAQKPTIKVLVYSLGQVKKNKKKRKKVAVLHHAGYFRGLKTDSEGFRVQNSFYCHSALPQESDAEQIYVA